MIKTIEFDTDDAESIKRARNVLATHLGQLNARHRGVSKNDGFVEKFNSCMDILGADIGSVYSAMNLDESPIYYVYLHCRPDKRIQVSKRHYTTSAIASIGATHIPFYVGKGAGTRAFDLDRNGTHRKVRQKLRSLGSDVHVTILKAGLTERDALALESKVIDILGVHGKGGCLVNLDEGASPIQRRALYQDAFDKVREINKWL